MNTAQLLNDKRNKLVFSNAFLKQAIQVEAEKLQIVKDSERTLSTVLAQNPENLAEISRLRKILNLDRSIHVAYQREIIQHQADIEKITQDIRDLEQRLNTETRYSLQDGFYKNKKDDFNKENNQNSGTASHYSNISSFPSMR
jgi:hypothetical protein